MIKQNSFKLITTLVVALVTSSLLSCAQPKDTSLKEVAREAYVYAYPMMEQVKTINGMREFMGLQFNDVAMNPKLPWENVGMPIVAPNLTSMTGGVAIDLSDGPITLEIPEVKDRYIVYQCVDVFTHNFFYMGSRANSGEGGRFTFHTKDQKVTGSGVTAVEVEGDHLIIIVRIDISNPDEYERVREIQNSIRLVGSPQTVWNYPVYDEEKAKSPRFVGFLNDLLTEVPKSEAALFKRFAQIGVMSDVRLSDEEKVEVQAGIDIAFKEIQAETSNLDVGNGYIGATEVFGTREFLNGNYIGRAAGAHFGLWGNSKEEANYFLSTVEGEGRIVFSKDEFPPLSDIGFWSITAHDGDMYVHENEYDSYVLTADKMVFEEDGSLVINFSSKPQSGNWLYTPGEKMGIVIRVYQADPNKIGTYIPPAFVASSTQSASAQTNIAPDKARAIAKEAYIFGYPMVDGYRIMYDYFVNRESPEFKTDWNQLHHIPRVYTPEDKAIQTPNSDTPYSFVGLDLRAEPIVLTIPRIEKDRYFSIQLIDLYTHNFGYIGSRVTGNDGGSFLVAGPSWQGEMPRGVEQVIRSETDLMLAIYRTQLFNTGDIDNVKRIMAGYLLQPLSEYLGRPAPKAPPAIDFPQPPTKEEIQKTLKVFHTTNFLLQFCPTHSSEKELMSRFATIGIGSGKTFDASKFSPEVQQAIGDGVADAWDDFNVQLKRANAGEVTSGDVFGTREILRNNYLYRMGGAVLGIWGNTAQEAIYPSYYVDADNQSMDGANNYTIRFAPGQLPPVHSFWSLTMYELPASLLVENPLNRYLLNSPMLAQFNRDADGGLTLYFQHKSPGKAKEPNWLPAPTGPFSVVLRLYWPRNEALNGQWVEPPMQKTGSI